MTGATMQPKRRMKMPKITYRRAKSLSYGGTRSLDSIRYIVIHYTGNIGDTAAGNANYFATGNQVYAGAHFFVDRKGVIYQTVPLRRIAWSVGGGWMGSGMKDEGRYYGKCRNANSISIELCDIATKDPSRAQIASLKWLIRWIRKRCPNAKKLLRHWSVNGKHCPGRMCGTHGTAGYKRWNKLKKAVL